MSTDAQVLHDAAVRSTDPFPLGDGRFAVTLPEDGTVHIIKPDETLMGRPARVKGTSTVLEVDGFAYLWDKHALPESEVFADVTRFVVTGVLNADVGAGGEGAGFRDHRVELVCRKTPAWDAWIGMDGQMVDQMRFAEFLEDRLAEVQEPSGAEMLELAQSFEASTSVEFKSAQVVSSGQRTLHYAETVAARAGQAGQITIPTVIVLALQPFEGGPAYRVQARFRYRIRNGSLTIGFKLERPEDVLREAFKDVREQVEQAAGVTVLLGTAPAAR